MSGQVSPQPIEAMGRPAQKTGTISLGRTHWPGGRLGRCRRPGGLMALLGVRFQLGLPGRKFGERRVGVGLLLALPALRRLAAILGVVAVLLVMTMVLAMILRKSGPVSGTPFAARIGMALALVARFRQ